MLTKCNIFHRWNNIRSPCLLVLKLLQAALVARGQCALDKERQ